MGGNRESRVVAADRENEIALLYAWDRIPGRIEPYVECEAAAQTAFGVDNERILREPGLSAQQSDGRFQAHLEGEFDKNVRLQFGLAGLRQGQGQRGFS